MDDSLSSSREAKCSATRFLATCLSFDGTESSRSKQSISGLRLVDFTKNLSLFPGINSKLLYMYSKKWEIKVFEELSQSYQFALRLPSWYVLLPCRRMAEPYQSKA